VHFPQNFSETDAVPRLFSSDRVFFLCISMTYTKMLFTYMANIKRKKDLTLMICLPAPNILFVYNLHIRGWNASAVLRHCFTKNGWFLRFVAGAPGLSQARRKSNPESPSYYLHHVTQS
jgi:hypothetical protein